ncbi:MAG: SRPBCC domain-containing protein [Devosia nanyangense]|uniref:SRPBCC domain-containing protein n=1 Tax=Devosia nanyangense TaxID=1228055 RepID=A0A933KZN4_9HYPH|nr:SRPBCC domain-containing protein [Devosia nanyangense]
MAQSNSARSFAPDEVLEITRMFDAPRELAWRMWCDPEHMVRWHGPEGYWLTDCEIDFRVGGRWRRCMSRAADHAHWIYGTYLEIEEPSRLRFTYINDFDEHEMVVTLDFTERDGKTVMHFHQAPFISVEERDSHAWGWSSGLDLLAAYLLVVKAGDGRLVGRPRIDGVAEDIAAAKARQEEVRRADTAKAH